MFELSTAQNQVVLKFMLRTGLRKTMYLLVYMMSVYKINQTMTIFKNKGQNSATVWSFCKKEAQVLKVHA